MKINKDRLEAFSQVSKSKNFGAAAEILCISQSALSQRISKLEHEVSSTLFIRGVTGIKLTQAGCILLDYACSLENMERETLNAIAGHSREKNQGPLRVAAYSSVLRSVVVPALAPLIRETPKIRVEFFGRELRELPGMLKSGEVDFIVLDYLEDVSDFHKVQIGWENIVHIMPRENGSEDMVFLDHDTEDMTTYSFFKFQSEKAANIKRCFYDDIFGIIEGVQLGLGQAIVSEHLVSDMEGVMVLPYSKKMSNPVVLYFHENRYQTQLHKCIVDALKQRASGLLGAE